MFYIDFIKNRKILKSDFLCGLNHIITTRETVIKSIEKDLQSVVKENIGLVCEYFNIEEKNLISPNQTHSTNIEVAKLNKVIYPDTDALILDNTEQAVFLNFADCTPIILYDDINNVAAVVHAGWRGTAGQIVIKTIEKLKDKFDSSVKNIIAAIAPTIGQCCYCIGEDVYKKLKSTIENEKDCFIIRDDRIYADLKKINYQQLLASGVEKIDLSNYCTSCSNELFFSYRKESGTTSRHSVIIKLNER